MSEPNTNEFTNKDLMQHLLHAAQHAATREELAQVRAELKADIASLGSDLKADIAKCATKTELTQLKDEILAQMALMQSQMTIKLGSIMAAGIAIIVVAQKLL